ncbi:MAG TPA: hypothetical protein VFU02_13585 [Polyangiaceae bacterium]|nr:hypothetical protein [Polyangiaceae bacterium]
MLLHQHQEASVVNGMQAAQAAALDETIRDAEQFLTTRGIELPSAVSVQHQRVAAPVLRPWSEILAAANETAPETVRLDDLLTREQIDGIVRKHRELEIEFYALHTLDEYDWGVAGTAGVLAALVDIFLVKVPRHPGFLGGPASDGGWLSNLVKDAFGKVLPQEKIRALERLYPVCFDASTSRKLPVEISGLGPSTHRFQSLGHDPVLAWIFGARDLLNGEFTAIDKNGQLVVQRLADPVVVGESLFFRVFEALQCLAGHLLSDVATSRGLPAPLTPMLTFLQVGSIGKQGYTVGEVARQMYRMGYDFRHFLASSVPTIMVEVIVRIAFFARRINDGAELSEAIPTADHPKLRTQLFLAHSIVTAANAGRVCFTKNPLALNWSQWLAFFRYLGPQLHWLLAEAEQQRAEGIRQHIQTNWHVIDGNFATLWRNTFADEPAEL